ncbi:MAG: TonB-dependent siderophore receptor [Geminocystis sp.]
MKKQFYFLSLTGLMILGANPMIVRAETIDSDLRSNLLLTQETKIITINNIFFEPTETGLQILVENDSSEPLQPLIFPNENNLVIEFLETQLGFEGLQQENISEEITAITVEPLEGNVVRMTIKGKNQAPSAQIIPADDNSFILSVTPVSDSDIATNPEEEEETIELVVTANRSEEEVENIPRSVTIINRPQIEEQTNITNDLRTILGNLVPGFGPPPSESTPRSIIQNLRGRSPLILIDGVPLTSNYGLDRELRTIDPDVIERIEVLRGPTAIYGGQATGGLINIITRFPPPETLETELSAGLGLSLTHPGDSFYNRVGGLVSGTSKSGEVDYLLFVKREDNGAFFDAEGDRIPETSGGGVIDATAYSILAKSAFYFDENQKLQLTFNFYDGRQDTNYISDPAIRNIDGIQKARALRVNSDTKGTDLAGDQNIFVSATYTHDDLMGSKALAQVYYRDYTSIVGAGDFRGGFFDAIVRQRATGDKWGTRLQIDTPLTFMGGESNVVWGLDYVKEDNQAPFEVFDPVSFDNNGTLRKIDERTFVPLHTLGQLGLFGQVRWDVNPNWLISGGLRHERIGLEVDDYTTFSGTAIKGGNLDFNATVFNLGTVYKITEQFNIFASFAQGFSVPAFGGVLRTPPPDFTNINQNLQLTEPIKVNNYEIGLRGQWNNIQASISGFYNTSDLGEDYAFNDGVSQLVRAPERIYGIEATLDTQLNDYWSLGGTFSWTEGENDEDDNGSYLPISTFRIQPIKLTGYIEHQTTPSWNNRLQFLYVANRDRAFKDGVDAVPVTDYFTVDYISNVKLGQGTLQIGIQNLFNNQYAPVQSQFLSGFNEIFNAAASGINLRVGYKINF